MCVGLNSQTYISLARTTRVPFKCFLYIEPSRIGTGLEMTRLAILLTTSVFWWTIPAYSAEVTGRDTFTEFFLQEAGLSDGEFDSLQAAFDATQQTQEGKLFAEKPVHGCIKFLKGVDATDWTWYRSIRGHGEPIIEIRDAVNLANVACDKAWDRVVLEEHQGNKIGDLRDLSWYCAQESWSNYLGQLTAFERLVDPRVLNKSTYLAEIRQRCDGPAEKFAAEMVVRERNELIAQQELKRKKDRDQAEAERIATARAEKQEAERERQESEYRNRITRKIKKLGYGYVVFDSGLTEVLNDAVERARPIQEMLGSVIRLDSLDRSFEVIQVLPGNRALMTSQKTTATIILEGAGGTLYEGTRLTAIDAQYVAIVDLATYTTTMGATKQAFVVRAVTTD